MTLKTNKIQLCQLDKVHDVSKRPLFEKFSAYLETKKATSPAMSTQFVATQAAKIHWRLLGTLGSFPANKSPSKEACPVAVIAAHHQILPAQGFRETAFCK